jgi:hypothetical protein
VMAVWEAYRSGDLTETTGPVVPETSPFRPRVRRVPLPVSADAEAEPMVAARAVEPEPALGQAGGSDRV